MIKGKSWLGLWQRKEVEIPYHPSIRHVAFYVDLDDIKKAKGWLEQRGINVKENFGFSPERQPLVLANNPQTHAAIYFQDPDDNSLESHFFTIPKYFFISPSDSIFFAEIKLEFLPDVSQDIVVIIKQIIILLQVCTLYLLDQCFSRIKS